MAKQRKKQFKIQPGDIVSIIAGRRDMIREIRIIKSDLQKKNLFFISFTGCVSYTLDQIDTTYTLQRGNRFYSLKDKILLV